LAQTNAHLILDKLTSTAIDRVKGASQAAAERTLASVQNWIEKHLRLKVNEAKSGTGRVGHRHPGRVNLSWLTGPLYGGLSDKADPCAAPLVRSESSWAFD